MRERSCRAMKISEKLSVVLCPAAGILLLLLLWQLASETMSGLIIASPEDTFQTFGKILIRTDFLSSHFYISMQRIFFGVTLGATAGFVLGILAGVSRPFRLMLEPFRWVLMSVPAVIVIMVAMLWFGMGSAMVVFITSVLLSPIIYVSTIEGMSSVDPDLLEMAAIYRFSLWIKIRDIYLMSIAAPLASGVAIVVGNGVRVVILSEVLGANEGIGYVLSSARTNLDIPDIYALVLLSLLIVGITDFCLLKPVQNRIMRWRVRSDD